MTTETPRRAKKAGKSATDSAQTIDTPFTLKIGHLGTFSQTRTNMAKIIRAVAAGQMPSIEGYRLCGMLNMLRAVIETEAVQHLRDRLDDAERADRAPVKDLRRIERVIVDPRTERETTSLQ